MNDQGEAAAEKLSKMDSVPHSSVEGVFLEDRVRVPPSHQNSIPRPSSSHSISVETETGSTKAPTELSPASKTSPRVDEPSGSSSLLQRVLVSHSASPEHINESSELEAIRERGPSSRLETPEPTYSTPLLDDIDLSHPKSRDFEPANFADTTGISGTNVNNEAESLGNAGQSSLLKNLHQRRQNASTGQEISELIRTSSVPMQLDTPARGQGHIDEVPLHSPMGEMPSQGLHNTDITFATEFNPSRGFMLAFLSICIITLAAALDATSLAIALPIITGKLNGTAIEAFWSGTSFLVTSAVFQPVIAGLSHIFGRKELILISALFFAVGSTLGAIAHNFTVMLVGRSIQGIGGGGILTLGEIMLTDLVPLTFRGAWFGYLGSVWAIGSVTGPLMGASFAQKVTWRWIFWINIPIIGIGAIAIALFLNLGKTPGGLREKLERFDWWGSVVFVGSTVSVLIPMTWGGVMYAWDSWRTVVPLVVGVLGNIAFGVYEWNLSRKCWDDNGVPYPGNPVEPIIRFTIFTNSTMVITYVQTVLHGIILWSLLYFLPLYYEGVKQYSLIITGVAALPETGFVAPMAVMVGIISAKTGHYRWAIWSGWGLTTVGAGLLVLLRPETSVMQWIFLNITISIGTGMLFTAMGLAVQAAGKPEDAGHAAGFYSFARVMGQSLGVAIGGVVFQNQIRTNMLSYPLLAPLAEQYSKDATVLAVIIKAMSESAQKTQLIQAYSDALSMIWVVMCAVSGMGLLSSVFIKAYTLEQEHKTLQGYKYDGVIEDSERGSTGRASTSRSNMMELNNLSDVHVGRERSATVNTTYTTASGPPSYMMESPDPARPHTGV